MWIGLGNWPTSVGRGTSSVLELDSLSKTLCAGQHSARKSARKPGFVCQLVVLFHKSTYIPHLHGLKSEQLDIFGMESLNLGY